MGSGKTTTGRRVAEALRSRGTETRFVPEAAEPHPVRVMGSLPDPRRPWAYLSLSEYRRASLEKWARFVAEASTSAMVHVFDGQLFHGDLTSMLLMDGGETELVEHSLEIAEIARPLDPLLVLFWQDDLRRSLRAIFDERGPTWELYQVNWKCAAPYCTRRGLAGFNGLVAFYETFRHLVDEVVARLPMSTKLIENSGLRWAMYEGEILGHFDTKSRSTPIADG